MNRFTVETAILYEMRKTDIWRHDQTATATVAVWRKVKFYFMPRLTISVTAKEATSSAYLPAPKPAS